MFDSETGRASLTTWRLSYLCHECKFLNQLQNTDKTSYGTESNLLTMRWAYNKSFSGIHKKVYHLYLHVKLLKLSFVSLSLLQIEGIRQNAASKGGLQFRREQNYFWHCFLIYFICTTLLALWFGHLHKNIFFMCSSY